MIDLQKIIEDLKKERQIVDEAITILERLLTVPEHVKGDMPKKPGRPRGSKNKIASDTVLTKAASQD